MLANELTDRIRNLGLNPTGFALRTGRVEASNNRAIMVMLPLAPYSERTDQMSGLYRGNQQIIVRSPDPEEAYGVSVAIQDGLRVEGHAVTMDKWTVTLFRAEGFPLLFPLNDADLYETSMRFDVSAYYKR